mmetsp:Transcript_31244/g.81052  ORF Transcript_31244/g.81052 Transcript_31244/m.81052 type:complete len:313 (+) Transcript_31244:1126-2064(+)
MGGVGCIGCVRPPPGAVGQPFPGVEVRILHDPMRDAEPTGEICYRGRAAFLGYLGELQATEAAVDQHGWVRTGDIGRLDPCSSVACLGRIQDLVITAGNQQWWAPEVEAQVKKAVEGVHQCMLVGHGLPHGMVLLTFQGRDGVLTAQVPGTKCRTEDEANHCPIFRSHVCKGLLDVPALGQLAAQCFRAVPEFTLGNGCLGRQGLLRRDVVLGLNARAIHGCFPEWAGLQAENQACAAVPTPAQPLRHSLPAAKCTTSETTRARARSTPDAARESRLRKSGVHPLGTALRREGVRLGRLFELQRHRVPACAP